MGETHCHHDHADSQLPTNLNKISLTILRIQSHPAATGRVKPTASELLGTTQ